MIIAILFCLAGSFLAATKWSLVRFFGFCFYTIANTLWIIYGVDIQEKWVIIQFSTFMLPTMLGLYTNYPRRKTS